MTLERFKYTVKIVTLDISDHSSQEMGFGFGMIEYGMVGFETVETETLGKVNQVHFVMVCKLQTWVYL